MPNASIDSHLGMHRMQRKRGAAPPSTSPTETGARKPAISNAELDRLIALVKTPRSTGLYTEHERAQAVSVLLEHVLELEPS